MLKCSPRWLSSINCLEKNRLKLFSKYAKKALLDIANGLFQLLLKRVAQLIIDFRGQLCFSQRTPLVFFPLINEIIICKLHFVFPSVFVCYKNWLEDQRILSVRNFDGTV